MSNVRVQAHIMTMDEFLAWEMRQEGRHEYVDGVIYALDDIESEYTGCVIRDMSGASFDHNAIVFNLSGAVSNRLQGKPCRGFTSSQKIRAKDDAPIFYPDIGIYCGKPKLGAENALLNTVAIFEVLSPSTERHDRVKKYHHYRQIETLREYFLVYQDTARIEAFRRTEDGGWDSVRYTAYTGLDDTLIVESAGIAIPLNEIYEGVELPEQDRIVEQR